VRPNMIPFALALLFLAVARAGAQSSAWERIKPGVTTQAEAIYAFGIPDVVEVEMEWPQFEQFITKPHRPKEYSLKYSPMRANLPIMNGPLGQTSSAFVYIKNHKVEYIEWDYCCIWKESAFQALLQDPAFQTGRVGKQVVGRKRLLHGDLSAMCGSDTGERCDDNLIVMFTPRR
jgi:hypothetical protein